MSTKRAWSRNPSCGLHMYELVCNVSMAFDKYKPGVPMLVCPAGSCLPVYRNKWNFLCSNWSSGCQNAKVPQMVQNVINTIFYIYSKCCLQIHMVTQFRQEFRRAITYPFHIDRGNCKRAKMSITILTPSTLRTPYFPVE